MALVDPAPAFDVLNHVVAPLLVAGVSSGVTWLLSKLWFNGKIDAAPKKYVEALDKLISDGLKEGEERAVVNARAIVATRNTLRASLVSISGHLNSEIDRLARQIGESVPDVPGPSRPTSDVQPSAAAAFETIQVLAKMWPAKRIQVEVEVRKLLAEMGITGK